MFLWQQLKHIGAKQLVLPTLRTVVFKLRLAAGVTLSRFSLLAGEFERLVLHRRGRVQWLLTVN